MKKILALLLAALMALALAGCGGNAETLPPPRYPPRKPPLRPKPRRPKSLP